MKRQRKSVKLSNKLLNAAKATAAQEQRTVSEQIECWIELGRCLSEFMDPQDILAITTGFSTPEIKSSEPLDAHQSTEIQSIKEALEKDQCGVVYDDPSIIYRASRLHLGLIERIAPDGSTTLRPMDISRFRYTNFGRRP